jgi:hypothetical protein
MASLFRRSSQREEAPAAVAPAAAGTTATSKVFPRFMAALGQLPAPVLLDLGSVVGANVSFFGEQLGCKIYVEDLFDEVEAVARRGQRAALPERLAARLAQVPGTVDGILCWDLFDYLERPAAQAVAARLIPLLRPGGLAHGLFGTTPVELAHYTRFAVEANDTFRLRAVKATPIARQVLTTRDIQRLFDGLSVVESVLLRTSAREILFRRT